MTAFGCGGAVQLGIPLLGDPQLDGHIRGVDMPVAKRLGEKFLHRDRGVRSVLHVLGEGLALVVPHDLQAAAGTQVDRPHLRAPPARRICPTPSPRRDGADEPVWVEDHAADVGQGLVERHMHTIKLRTCGRRNSGERSRSTL